MALSFNGIPIKRVFFKGNTVKQLSYNGNDVPFRDWRPQDTFHLAPTKFDFSVHDDIIPLQMRVYAADAGDYIINLSGFYSGQFVLLDTLSGSLVQGENEINVDLQPEVTLLEFYSSTPWVPGYGTKSVFGSSHTSPSSVPLLNVYIGDNCKTKVPGSPDTSAGFAGLGQSALSVYRSDTPSSGYKLPKSWDQYPKLFFANTGLSDVPNSKATEIGTMAFYSCSRLSYAYLPATLRRIANTAFRNCSTLKNVTIQENIESIGTRAFGGCPSLENVWIRAANPPALGKNAFTLTSALTIHVPDGSEDAYKAAENWSDYADRIVPNDIG